MTACTQAGCTGTYNLDDYCDTCGNPAASALVSIPAGARRKRRRHRHVSAATAASPRPADRTAPTTVAQATACMEPGCTGTIVDDYCDVCGTPANASISVPRAGNSRRPHPHISAPAGASPRPPDRPVPTTLSQTTACSQPGCTGTIVDDYCDICGAPASAAGSLELETAAAPANPELLSPKTPAAAAPAAGLTAFPQLMACTQPGCTGTIVDDYCDVCGMPASAPDSVPPETAATVPTPPTPRPAPAATTPPAKTAAAAKPEPAPAAKPAAAAHAQPEPAPAATTAAAAPAAGPPAAPQLTACTQPGCTGTIVDDYCDVCGMPASAPDSVPPETAATASPPAKTAVAAAKPEPAPTKPAAAAAQPKAEPTPAAKPAAAAAQPKAEPTPAAKPAAAAAQPKAEPTPAAKPAAAAAQPKAEPTPAAKPAAAAAQPKAEPE